MSEDRELFKCGECAFEFEHEAGESVQCPRCGYESGVFPMSMIHDAGPKPKQRKRKNGIIVIIDKSRRGLCTPGYM